jgi:RNA-binding protein
MWVDKEISNKNIKEKISERVAGKIDMQLGKSGITEAFLKEVEFRLKKQKVVKIRVLKSFRRVFNTSIEKIAEELLKRLILGFMRLEDLLLHLLRRIKSL